MAHSGGRKLPARAFIRFLELVAGGDPAKARQISPDSVRHILVVELWNIGDVVLLIPFLTQLRAIFPAARVTLLARAHARPILEGTGLVDDFVEGNGRGNWLSLDPRAGSLRELWELRRRLKGHRFDLAFQCRHHVREHVILAMSGARHRIGYAFDDRAGVLTDPVPVGDPHRHKSDDWLNLLNVVGGAVNTPPRSIAVTEIEREAAARFLGNHGFSPGDIIIGIHPGASVPEKRWPLERFTEVARSLAARDGVRVLSFTDPAGYGESIGQLEGVTTASVELRELIALLERCSLLVCNDSGPMHLAGGLGVPVVAVFAGGIARWFAPAGEGHELISAAGEPGHPETPARLESVSVAKVMSAIDRLMAARMIA